MIRDELLDLVKSNTGRTDKDTVIDQGLNFAIQRISQRQPFDELRNEFDCQIVENDTQTQLPSDLDQIVELRLIVPSSPTLSYPMELWRKTKFIKLFPNVIGSTITGRPLWCYRDRNMLYLDRKSNGTYTIRITGFKLGVFSNGFAGDPVTEADECLTAYATHYLYKSIQMYADAQFWFGEYNQLFLELVNAKQREIGNSSIATEWSRTRPVQPNQPWLDPFEGHRN